MNLLFVRIFFLFLSGFTGYQYAVNIGSPNPLFISVLVSSSAILIIAVEVLMHNISLRGLSTAVFGLILGLLMTRLLFIPMSFLNISEENLSVFKIGITFILCYLSVAIALRGKDDFNIIIPYVKFTRQNQRDDLIILDTSVIIDGRIADIAKTHFIEGKFIIPKFVLRELQHISDSADSIRRNRGRRGLDMLNKIRRLDDIQIKISDEEFPEIKEVDAKLVKLAKVLSAKILTNDFNLAKVAQLQGITVLNINELANALRPVIFPGEIINMRLVKEGKEYNQAIAYLNDGTMVVVENARQFLGQLQPIVVTSILQTQTGRMIFGKIAGR